MHTFDGKEYPDKLFYRIQEASVITGEKPHVLRYWESEFPQLKPEKDKHDQRRYRKSDIELILQIKQLLHGERYTIEGAKKKISPQRKKASPTPHPNTRHDPERKTDHKKQIKRLQRELRSIRADLQSLVEFMKR